MEASPENSTEAKILCMAFSYDQKYLTVGTTNEYKVFSIDPLQLVYEKELCGGVGSIVSCYKDKMVAFVGGGDSPAVPTNELRIWDNRDDKELVKFVFDKPVLNAKFRPGYLCVVLEEKVVITEWNEFKNKHKFITKSNPYGAVAVTQSDSAKLCAFPGQEDEGDIIVYDITSKEHQAIFAGYTKNSQVITCLEFNDEGTMLACATTEGKTIHVYNASSCECIHTFSRGTLASHITFLNFQRDRDDSSDDLKLLASSTNGTIHIFEVKAHENTNTEGYLSKYVGYFTSKQSSLTKFRISDPETISILPSKDSIQAFSKTGKVYFGSIDLEESSDVVLESTFDLMKYKMSA